VVARVTAAFCFLAVVSFDPVIGNVPDIDEENDMTELRQRMDDAMVLRGFALRTRETYLACVAGLAKHYHCSPDRLDAEQIQAYLLHLITEKKLAYASVNQAACACRFLFGNVLQQHKINFDIPWPRCPSACHKSSRAKRFRA
jgi:hypothetical protein